MINIPCCSFLFIQVLIILDVSRRAKPGVSALERCLVFLTQQLRFIGNANLTLKIAVIERLADKKREAF
jgi:hypothetical protein